GGNGDLDSDADPASGRTTPFTLMAGQSDQSRDVGAVPDGDVTFTGFVSQSGPTTVNHKFTVTTPALVTARLTWENQAANLNMFLKNPSGQQVASAASATAVPEVLSNSANSVGTWTLSVTAKTGASFYAVDVSFDTSQAVVPATYQQTIGGSARASVYPSG